MRSEAKSAFGGKKILCAMFLVFVFVGCEEQTISVNADEINSSGPGLSIKATFRKNNNNIFNDESLKGFRCYLDNFLRGEGREDTIDSYIFYRLQSDELKLDERIFVYYKPTSVCSIFEIEKICLFFDDAKEDKYSWCIRVGPNECEYDCSPQSF